MFPNNKPSATKDLADVLNKKKRVFFQGSADEKKQVKKEVKLAVRKANNFYRAKFKSNFKDGSLRNVWKGLNNMAAINAAVDVNRLRISIEGGD